ncbi:hypothetical protein OROMI_005131 [Orobanche minor]
MSSWVVEYTSPESNSNSSHDEYGNERLELLQASCNPTDSNLLVPADVFLRRAISFKDLVVEVTWRNGGNKGSLDPTVYTGVMGTALTCLRSYEATGNRRDLQLCSEIVDACASAAQISNRRMRGGAGKSMALVREMIESGPRHTRARGVDASVRRQREAARTAHIGSSDVGDEDLEYDSYDDEDMHEGGGDSSSAVCRVRKGRGGRFVASGSSSSKRRRPEADTDWIVTEEMPGGPFDGSVIPSFNGHVASRIWQGEMRGLLKCHSRATACQSLSDWRSMMSPRVVTQISGTGLSHLSDTMFRHIDFPLISAFVERWQPDTNSFHMPFGEITIMLHDVWQILRIPVEGRLVCADSTSSQLQIDSMEVLGVSRTELLASHWGGGGILIESIFSLCRDSDRVEDTQAIAWVWMLLGATLLGATLLGVDVAWCHVVC